MTVAELKGLEEVRFTPTQREIMNLLSDGKTHTKEELHKLLYDDLGAVSNVFVHITNLRKIIRPAGYIITIQSLRRKPYYVLSQSIAPPE